MQLSFKHSSTDCS